MTNGDKRLVLSCYVTFVSFVLQVVSLLTGSKFTDFIQFYVVLII